MGKLYVGTSGWAYKEWKAERGTPGNPGKPGFYPADLPQSRFLEHYATKLTACEINATYHRRQEETTLKKWADAVPDDFRFAVKGHRAITPRSEDFTILSEFAGSMQTLSPHLATMFFQFPLKRDGNEAGFERFLSAVDWKVPPVFDLKHESWHTDAVTQQIAEAGGTICLSDREGNPPDALPPGPIAYVRLRGEHYDEQDRAAWKDLLKREAAERDVYVFAKHEGVPGDDPSRGVGLAQWLLS